MSKHIAKASIVRAMRYTSVSSFLLRREQERFVIYTQAQEVAANKRDYKEVERLEGLISNLILV